MTAVRRPAVAGTFYPANPPDLRSLIARYLTSAESGGTLPKAIIVPHAGYQYSGPVAASAFARLRRVSREIERVVLMGPAHYAHVRGIALPSADEFETPLGRVPLDASSIESLRGLPQVEVSDLAHAREHCLEVQLPFLQLVLVSFRIVPFLVGDAAPAEVADVIERLWGGDETLIVISSDLSHYLDYESARKIDAATSRAIEALRPEDITHHQACGRNPLNGLLREAKRHGLCARTLDLRNSGDTAGPRDQVVGYGAYAFA